MIERQLKVWFAGSLMRWHAKHNHRKMPWKGIRDPYRIWLSEVILQQTRVEQGTGYYNRFTQRFPDVHALAQANDNEVFKLWEGLGYYSRCRNLLHTARFISRHCNGKFPATKEGLLSLKGVGSYTAAAIGSFAFGLPLAVVDGNVLRVLSRVFGIKIPIDQKEGRTLLEQLASQLLHVKEPGQYNQAIMDLGATVCKPKAPLCTLCPFQKKCAAFASENPEAFPVKSKKIKIQSRFFYYLHVQYKDRILVRQRTGSDIWRGLHEFILQEKDEPAEERELHSLSFWGLDQPLTLLEKQLSETQVHPLTHQRIHYRFLKVLLKNKISWEGYFWVTRAEMDQIAFPRPIARYLSSLFNGAEE